MNDSSFPSAQDQIRDGLLSAIAPIGLLAGSGTVRRAAANLNIASYLGHLLHGEVLPSIPGYDDEEAGEELVALADTVTDAFTDPAHERQLMDLAHGAASRWQAHDLPFALDAWAGDREAPLTVFAFAALAVLYGGHGFDAARVAESGFEVQDDAALAATARDAFDSDDVEGWLRQVADAAGFFAGLATANALTDRLAAEGAPHARLMLTEGITVALKAIA